MIFFTKYCARRKIKNQLREIIVEHIDLKGKKISDLKKTQLDSVDLMVLLQLIEAQWGPVDLALLYQAQNFDDVADLILKNQS